jgi:protein SCO1
VMAIDEADETPMYWDSDVSQAQLAHDVTFLLDEG